MMDFMSILVKCILKMFLKIYDEFCIMMESPYELFILIKWSPGPAAISVLWTSRLHLILSGEGHCGRC